MNTDGHRDGETYSPQFDYDRLNQQARDVYDVMCDGEWHTLRHIATCTLHPEASISARLRDFRKPRFGGMTVNRKRGYNGIWVYQLEIGNDT